jgi:hypothetical protein
MASRQAKSKNARSKDKQGSQIRPKAWPVALISSVIWSWTRSSQNWQNPKLNRLLSRQAIPEIDRVVDQRPVIIPAGNRWQGGLDIDVLFGR